MQRPLRREDVRPRVGRALREESSGDLVAAVLEREQGPCGGRACREHEEREHGRSTGHETRRDPPREGVETEARREGERRQRERHEPRPGGREFEHHVAREPRGGDRGERRDGREQGTPASDRGGRRPRGDEEGESERHGALRRARQGDVERHRRERRRADQRSGIPHPTPAREEDDRDRRDADERDRADRERVERSPEREQAAEHPRHERPRFLGRRRECGECASTGGVARDARAAEIPETQDDSDDDDEDEARERRGRRSGRSVDHGSCTRRGDPTRSRNRAVAWARAQFDDHR